ncbi:MAG: UDP-N-acetyl glucosamine 2-epimerase [Nitrososphaeraceae archaeon]
MSSGLQPAYSLEPLKVLEMKIVSVVGARPNFVKLAPLHKSLSRYCDHKIIHTGQHYDYEMSDIFFKELQIPRPDINLGVGSTSPGDQIGRMINGLEAELGFGKSEGNGGKGVASRPDLVIVYGDTNSTFAGAFSASVNSIPVAHVEAGLRSFDRRMPEERNRILTDHLSDLLFAPTCTASTNLKEEHTTGRIVNSGDISVEVINEAWRFSKKSAILKELSLESKNFILFTMHRAESTGSFSSLKAIVESFQELKKRTHDRSSSSSLMHPKISGTGSSSSTNKQNVDGHQLQIVFPIHPRTEKILKTYGLYDKLVSLENVKIIKPLGYIDFLRLVKESYKVVTDSGGLQKEAYLCSIPCITIRKSTEWVETLQGGWNKLCSFEKHAIVDSILQPGPSLKKNYSKDIFGSGNASEIIRDSIIFGYHK